MSDLSNNQIISSNRKASKGDQHSMQFTTSDPESPQAQQAQASKAESTSARVRVEDSPDSSPSEPSEDERDSSDASTPVMEKLPLPLPGRSTYTSSKDDQPHLSKPNSSKANSRPKYIRGVDTSPATSFARVPGTKASDPPSFLSMWTTPSSGRSKRAPTFFIGADIERWQNHDRDNMGLNNKLAWNKGTSSAVFPTVRSEGDLYEWEYDSGSASGSGSDSDEEISDEEGSGDNDQAIDSDYASEDEIQVRRSAKLNDSSSRELFGSVGDKEKARDRLPSLGLSDLEVTDSPTSTTQSPKNTSRRSSRGAHSHSHAQGHGSSRSRRQSHASNSSKLSSGRERRFSTNGPEAAVHRHETVIGIHTPRRDSTSSAKSSTSGSGRLLAITPLSQIPPFRPETSSNEIRSRSSSGSNSVIAAPSQAEVPSSSSPEVDEADKDQASAIDLDDDDEAAALVFKSQVDSKEKTLDPPSGKVRSGKNILQQQPTSSRGSRSSSPGSSPSSTSSPRRTGRKRSSIVLAEAAAAAAKAAAAGDTPALAAQDRESLGVDPNGDALKNTLAQGSITSIKNAASLIGLKRSPSPSAVTSAGTRTESPALKLARRRKPIKVEGTLYDRSGPFKEGSVTDGLSVRLFSTAGAPIGPNGASQRNGGVSQSRKSHTDPDSTPPTTYLITTPDNRVASAAKLRRWAMDSSGRFYAAMEIKSIEAKLKNADPNVALGSNLPGGAKELMKELKSTYLEDILDEVQKAETLNPSRKGAVAHVLKTEDGKFIRLEEDYPEEAFFVVAGCEEEELAPVIKLIFTMAIKALHKFHASGWAHGDVKLENLMFDQSGELVVIDYENANPYCSNNDRNGAAALAGPDPQASQSLADLHQDPDGCVQLVSYDWTPPEAAIGPFGRRMGPSGDLFALGCNLVRAFALRDGVEDTMIRQCLLGSGQDAFFAFRDSLIRTPRSGFPKAEDVDLGPIFGHQPQQNGSEDHLSAFRKAAEDNGRLIELNGSEASSIRQDNTPTENDDKQELDAKTPSATPLSDSFSSQSTPPSSTSSSNSSDFSLKSSLSPVGSKFNPGLPTPARLLQRFATQAPKLLQYVLARCITERVVERSLSSGAELEGLKLADQMEVEDRKELEIGRLAVEKAIDLSGSSWVRPKLNEARASLGLQ